MTTTRMSIKRRTLLGAGATGQQGPAEPTGATGAPGSTTSQTLYTQVGVQTITGTTETSLIVSGTGSLSITAPPVGRTVRISGKGYFSTAALSVGTLTLKVKLGGVVLTSCTLAALGLGLTSLPFELDVALGVTVAGSSGAILPSGQALFALGAAVAPNLVTLAGSAVSVNLSGTTSLDVTASWSLGTARNSITLLTFVVEQLN